jgi:ABC-2 type transport system ATP-binding protein
VTLSDAQGIDPVLDLLRERGARLRHLEEKRQTLEEAFLATVDAAEPGVDGPTPKPARARAEVRS